MGTIAFLFVLGVFLSAFFSGSETGFYRVTRVRLVLDGLGGDWLSRFLLFLTNHPALFVATTLIGNNLANYMVSLSIVLFTQATFPGNSTAEMALPLVMAPFLFVYGELLPKYFFYRAPNFLLRRTSWLFFLFTVLFAPCSALLWVLGRALQQLLGESPETVRLALARTELEDFLEEGGEFGILNKAQRRVAQGVFGVANRRVTSIATPLSRVWTAKIGSKVNNIIRVAKRRQLSVIPIVEMQGKRTIPIGYVRICDLCMGDGEEIENYHPLPEVKASDSCISAITQLHSTGELMAKVVSRNGVPVGIVTMQQLQRAILDAKKQPA
ncbi:CNNM domain-containing protein [Bremerella sp. T1]|uniref:CNNM domain-containing protein n=1 Tax=Bremerella sp. TYQ1 TaxID=3119568 RepID=UPI001CCA5A0E|nr:CNNM domain-containing protein [Bremerella volcania]UBM38680.1 CNNM domain-containing protein [Bremerella volcania]